MLYYLQRLVSLLVVASMTAALPLCPHNVTHSGWTRQLLMASDHVSWPDGSPPLPDVLDCNAVDKSTFRLDASCTTGAPYYTRMRVYTQEKDPSNVIIAFRPTQAEGGAIHANRATAPCTFLDRKPSCGRVHARFQEAFVELMRQCGNALVHIGPNVSVTGHSLGGAFSLFMAAKLFYDYNITVARSYGFAGPFIGDYDYTVTVQDPLAALTDIRQFQTVDSSNPSNADNTVIGYNVDDGSIFIDTPLVCEIPVVPLPVDMERQQYDPGYSYGMHDLKNYIHGVESCPSS